MLQQRLKMGGRPLVSYDELAQWPAEEVQAAKEKGQLKQVDDAKGVVCTECPKSCWKPVEVREKQGRLVGVIRCEDEDCAGLIPVELERLQQWEIVAQKPRRRTPKKKLKTPKVKPVTRFKRWDKRDSACFVHDSGKIKFCYREEVKTIPFQKSSQAPRVLAGFLMGVQIGKDIQKVAVSKSSPSQIVRNINRTINKQLRKIGFTDVGDVGFIWYNEETYNYELWPTMTDVETFNRM